MGVEINLEVLTDKGRIDGVLEFKDLRYMSSSLNTEKPAAT